MPDIVQSLNDIELAVLVCLIANEHCIIRVEDAQLEEVNRELEIICAKTFGLSCTTIACNQNTTSEEFAEAVVDNRENSAFHVSVRTLFCLNSTESELSRSGIYHLVNKSKKRLPSRETAFA